MFLTSTTVFTSASLPYQWRSNDTGSFYSFTNLMIFITLSIRDFKILHLGHWVSAHKFQIVERNRWITFRQIYCRFHILVRIGENGIQRLKYTHSLLSIDLPLKSWWELYPLVYLNWSNQLLRVRYALASSVKYIDTLYWQNLLCTSPDLANTPFLRETVNVVFPKCIIFFM